MGTLRVCDGCGSVESEDAHLKTHGILNPLEYCQDCSGIVSNYLAGRDRIHEAVCQKWDDETRKLKDDVCRAHPKMRLPDDY